MSIGVCLKPLLLVTEYMENGSLYSILHESKIALNMLQKISIALDVAKATAFLHGKEFIHRDLKSSNILVIFFENKTDYRNRSELISRVQRLETLELPKEILVGRWEPFLR